MKKLFSVFLPLLLLAMWILPSASADLIWIPQSRFFNAHESECVKSDRLFEAAKDTRYYSEPDGEEKSDIPEGTVLRVAYTWQDRWGSVDWSDDWVDLNDFRRLYDSQDFREDHAAELLGAGGELLLFRDAPKIVWNEDAALKSLREMAGELPETGTYDVVLWDYPGSDRITGTLGAGMGEEKPTYGPDFSNAWMDEEGRVWLYFSTYFYGRQDGWVCLSDMSSTEPVFVTERYADAAQEEKKENSPEDGESKGTAGGILADGSGLGGGRPPLLPIAAVLLVTAVTAVLLAVLKQKKAGEH